MNPVLALRHVEHESLGLLADTLARADLEVRCVDLYESPRVDFSPDDCSGAVVLGGPMNVDETDIYPFLAAEVAWLTRALAAELPVLGICLGSQLLAKTLGARVVPNRVKEIGWYDVDLTAAAAGDPLFCGCAARQRVFQWHGDTFDLPRGATHLARSPLCEHQAFRYGRSAYGLQFHLEVTAPMVEDWLDESRNCGELASLDYIDPWQIRRSLADEMTRIAPAANAMFTAFAGLCRERR